MKKSKAPKKLNLILDNVSFGRLEKIKAKNGDPSLTHSVKRAIALLEFIDKERRRSAALS